MTTATKSKGKPAEVEALPKWPEGSVEAQALEKIRQTYRAEPGPLPKLGEHADRSLAVRSDLLTRAIMAREHSGKRSFFANDVLFDHSPIGEAIVANMTAAADRFGRVAIGDALAEQQILIGVTDGSQSQFDGPTQCIVGELAGIERRLSWIYASLPAQVAAHFPTPPGAAARKLHARRAELIAKLDDAFSRTHYSTGAAALNAILSAVVLGPSLVDHAIAGWVRIGTAIRGGGGFPDGFAAAWNEVIPAACESFAEFDELAPFIVRIN